MIFNNKLEKTNAFITPEVLTKMWTEAKWDWMEVKTLNFKIFLKSLHTVTILCKPLC